MIEARIAQINRILSEATVVDTPKRSNRVNIGSSVTVTMNGEQRMFTVVGSAEANIFEEKISNESPVGAALVGHKKGDELHVSGPTGRSIDLTILKIEQ